MKSAHFISAAIALGATYVAPSSYAQESPYKGVQMNFVVSADAGNSYDMFARMIGRYLPKHIPGQPTVIVQNMPGAGGLRATNWLYNVAPKDGNTIGMINNTLPFDPLYGNKQAQFDAAKFNWLGSPSKENALLIVWHTVPVKSVEDLKTRELVVSATGAGSTPAFFARVLSSLFDFKVKIIPGYKSQTEGFLAMERGENDGNASPFWSSLNSEFPHWVAEKKIRPIVYYGALRVPEIEACHMIAGTFDYLLKVFRLSAQGADGRHRRLSPGSGRAHPDPAACGEHEHPCRDADGEGGRPAGVRGPGRGVRVYPAPSARPSPRVRSRAGRRRRRRGRGPRGSG